MSLRKTGGLVRPRVQSRPHFLVQMLVELWTRHEELLRTLVGRFADKASRVLGSPVYFLGEKPISNLWRTPGVEMQALERGGAVAHVLAQLCCTGGSEVWACRSVAVMSKLEVYVQLAKAGERGECAEQGERPLIAGSVNVKAELVEIGKHVAQLEKLLLVNLVQKLGMMNLQLAECIPMAENGIHADVSQDRYSDNRQHGRHVEKKGSHATRVMVRRKRNFIECSQL
ncbi:hypothetical protein BDW62DRAFT_178735 [Aspergillus aurantiobrunneus]